MITTAIAPPATAPQIDSPPSQILNVPASPSASQLYPVNRWYTRAPMTPRDDDGDEDLADLAAVVAPLRPPPLGDLGGREHAERQHQAVRVQLERADLDDAPRRARDVGQQHRPAIVGPVQVSTTSAPIYHPHEGGSVLRIRIVLATLLVTTGVAACKPPVVPPPTARRPRRSPAARCSRPTTPGTPNISGRPVNANSANYIASINASRTTLHPDFGGNGEYGIPYLVVGANEPLRTIRYTAYGDESDPGPFPIPPTAPVEGGADVRTVIATCSSCSATRVACTSSGARSGAVTTGMRPSA